MLESPIFKRFLVITIYIFSTGFFTLILVPEQARKLAEMAGIGIILLFLILNALFGARSKIRLNYKKEVYLFLLATFFSMFIAYTFHNQGFAITLVAQRYMYFFLFYFFLHSMKPDIRDIEKMIIPLGLLYAFIYIAQYVLFPNLILDSRVDMERGTIRIFFPGGSFMVLAYYLSLQKLLKEHKFEFLIYCLIFLIVHGILQGTRQSLASIVLLTASFIFFSKQVKSRALIILLSGVAALAIFIVFQDIFMEMIAVTQKEGTARKENIRLVAMRFFLTDFMPNNWAYVFGNGQDSFNSSFGKIVGAYKTLGLYQSDIGLVGDYSKYGILFVIAQLSIVFRIIFSKLPPEIVFMRYYFISRVLVMFSGSNMFSDASGIAFGMIILYYIDIYKHQEQNSTNEEHQLPENDKASAHPASPIRYT